MKILLISNMYPGKRSNLGIFVKHQKKALEDSGVEIIKVTKDDSNPASYISFYLKSVFILLFKSYDIVHAHYGFHSALAPALLRKKALYITFHGSDALIEPFRNRFYFWLQKFVVRRAHKIIAVSNHVRNTLISELGADPNKVEVISCGVDTLKFVPMNKKNLWDRLGIKSDYSAVILFVGKIEYLKGVDLIYKIASQIHDVLFLFAGEGRLKSNISNCKYLGYWPNEKMNELMNVADIFILPSRSEGTPVVLLEALSCGIPVIASNIGGCVDLIKEGLTGYLFPASDSESLRKKIVCMLKDSDKRAKMGENGRRDVVKNYDRLKIANKIIKLYGQA